ncbi:MAG: hypothetical protein Q9212_001144 [Teloschistes hypoglaucus]
MNRRTPSYSTYRKETQGPSQGLREEYAVREDKNPVRLSTEKAVLIRISNFEDAVSFALLVSQTAQAWPSITQKSLTSQPWANDHGHNELFIPTPDHIIPGKKPLQYDKQRHYYEPHHNDAVHGTYKRAPCPALNTLANRGFIPRSGKHITYENLAQAARDVYNFGDDNVCFMPADAPKKRAADQRSQIMIVLVPAFALHPNQTHIDLDQFADDKVQHAINCPAAPTRLDRESGHNIDLNTTLLASLLSRSKDNETLTLEDMAEHHHLRHNQSRAGSKNWQFGNSDATCALAQYTNLVGVLGRNGKHGLQTLYVEDVKKFYTSEDLPDAYERRELPYYAIEATQLIDRMTHHIGYQIVRPFPSGDHDGRDVEPVKALYEEKPGCVD